jgi:hypothetical protein
MTVPPQGHPQHELRRRIADCRERLRRARTGPKMNESATPGTHDEPPAARGRARRRGAHEPARKGTRVPQTNEPKTGRARGLG